MKKLFYEERIEEAILQRFNLPPYNETLKQIIKISDNEVLYNEAKVLMNNKDNWATKNLRRELDIDTSFRDMKEVEKEYLKTFKELTSF